MGLLRPLSGPRKPCKALKGLAVMGPCCNRHMLAGAVGYAALIPGGRHRRGVANATNLNLCGQDVFGESFCGSTRHLHSHRCVRASGGVCVGLTSSRVCLAWPETWGSRGTCAVLAGGLHALA